MSLTDTPSSHKVFASSAIPPGLSDTVTENLTKRPSAAKPLSKHRPRIVVSMFPPHKGITTLFRTIDQLLQYYCFKLLC